MYDNQIFSDGVQSVLKAQWTLSLETPLVIRNGLAISYKVDEAVKTRNKGVRFTWRAKNPADDEEYEVAALHYGYKIKDSKVESYYFVPPSSVRGALRSWTIRHLVQAEYLEQMTPPKVEEKEKTARYLELVRKALDDPNSGYPLIANLFGLAFDAREEAGIAGNAGRLQLETEAFSQTRGAPIAINGSLDDGEFGPDNAQREMVVRNPLDRITHASKQGGLHHFLEFCQGETFTVHLTILNPRHSDLGLLSVWVREMNDGLLRIGALSSIGRGRVRVKQPSYQLWQLPKLEAWPHFVPDTTVSPGEALADIWQCYRLPDEKTLHEFEPALVQEIGG